MSNSKLQELLSSIQVNLKAPKNQFNSFGKYNYRNCEDILEAVKPMLDGATLTLSDDVIEVGGRVYVKATSTISLNGEQVATSAMAREAVSRKGMDDSQLTGATSSYARKYALGGLFLVDDNKDADAGNDSTEYTQPAPPVCVSKEQAANIEALATEKSVPPSEIYESYGADSMGGVPMTDYESIIKKLEDL